MLARSMSSQTFIQQIFVVYQALDFVLGTQKEKVKFTYSRGSKSVEHVGEGRTVECMCHAREDAPSMLIK